MGDVSPIDALIGIMAVLASTCDVAERRVVLDWIDSQGESTAALQASAVVPTSGAARIPLEIEQGLVALCTGVHSERRAPRQDVRGARVHVPHDPTVTTACEHPLIGHRHHLVILKITWDPWRVVSTSQPGEIDQPHQH